MSAEDIVNSIQDSFTDLAGRTADYLPEVIGALVVLVVGLIVSRLLARLLGQVIAWIEDLKYYQKLMKLANFKYAFAEPLEKISYWVFLLIFVSTAVSILGLDVLTDTFNAIIGYIPTALSAALVLGLAMWGGRVLQDIVVTTVEQSKLDSRYKNAMGVLTYVAVLVFGATIALSQLGFDTLIITTNVSIIVGGFALATGIAFGLGSKNVAGSLVASWYTREHVRKGQRLKVGDVTGEVKEVSSAAVTLKTSDGDVIVPMNKIMS